MGESAAARAAGDADVLAPFIACRAPLTAVLAGGMRGVALIAPWGLVSVGAEAGHATLALVLLAVLCVADAVTVVHLRTCDGPCEWLRLAVYGGGAVAVAAFLGVLDPDQAATDAVGVAGIFVAERAFAAGLVRGIVVGAVVALASVAGRALVDAPIAWGDTVIYAVGPAFVGLVLGRYVRHQLEVSRRRAAADAEAHITAATLQVRSALQIGSCGAVLDRIQAAYFRLSLAGQDDAGALRGEAARYKAAVAEETRSRAAYLVDVLGGQAASARRAEPRLAFHHRFVVAGADGLTVLSPAQAEELTGRLDALQLRGDVPVRLLSRDESTWRTELLVGSSTTVTLSGVTGGRRWFLAPAGFGIGALLVIGMANPSYQHVGLPVALAGAGTVAVAGAVAHRWLARAGEVASTRVGLLAVLPCLVLCLVTLDGRVVSGDRIVLPILPGCSVWAFVVGTVWHRLPGAARVLTAGGMIVTTLATSAYLTVDVPRGSAPATVRQLVAEYLLPVLTVAATARVARSSELVQASVARAVARSTAERRRAAVTQVRARERLAVEALLTRAWQAVHAAPVGPHRAAAIGELSSATARLADPAWGDEPILVGAR